MKTLFVAVLTALTIVTLLSCAARDVVESPPGGSAPRIDPVLRDSLSQQTEWEKTLSLAKKEGRVLLYSTVGSEVRAAIISSYKAFTGLEADVVLGKGADISEKILTERRAGLKLADVYIGG